MYAYHVVTGAKMDTGFRGTPTRSGERILGCGRQPVRPGPVRGVPEIDPLHHMTDPHMPLPERSRSVIRWAGTGYAP
jgi:hypothetical protein